LSTLCNDEDIVTPLGDYYFNRNESGEWLHKATNPGDFHQHDSAAIIKERVPKEVWNSYLKFSITRNPWDRMVSDFFWRRRRDSTQGPHKRFYHYLGIRFDDHRQMAKLFTNFIRNDGWDNNDRFYIINGALCIDYVIRFENLASDLKEVCKQIGLPEVDLPHLKAGMRKRDHHYSEYYDEGSRAIVAERHGNDIELFGYQFESHPG